MGARVMNVDVYAAKTQLSRLIDLAMAGQEIVITRHGRPVARLIGAGAIDESLTQVSGNSAIGSSPVQIFRA